MVLAIPSFRLGLLFVMLWVGTFGRAEAQFSLEPDTEIEITAPDAAMAERLFPGFTGLRTDRVEGAVPGWKVTGQTDALAGHIASTWEITGSVGYSGKPMDVLVAVGPTGTITGAALIRQSEPILTLGLSDADIARFVEGFAGVDLRDPLASLARSPSAPDVIARATVSTGVIRDSILRTARTLALARGLVPGPGINRAEFEPRTLDVLLAEGSLARLSVTLDQAAPAFAGARVPVPSGAADFLDLWIAVADPPTIGRALLGEQQYTRVVGALGANEVALFVASRGLQGHRGTDWRRTGVFDRIALVQDGRRFELRAEDYARLDKLALVGLPEFRERSIFRVSTEVFDPTAPFRVEITASRSAAAPDQADLVLTTGVDYALPEEFIRAAPPEPPPLWRQTWDSKRLTIIGVAAMQGLLTLMFFFQGSLVRRPRVWRAFRLAFLTVTLFWLGWVVNGQLSVVQVVAFLQSLLTGFHWETFLIEPVIFILWAGVALGLLFWGRGVYCGWLCPFGALQELTNAVAQRLGVPQIAVPHALHERLWVIKYTLFMAILGLSFYSMKDALILAEAEPFKTAISLRMIRAWPFVAFVVVLLAAGLFIERFYCRYLCPLGAALAIPAKLKIFDWLRRRPQCGRECRLCETKCTVGAIDPLGRINVNECVLCLRCQVVYHDANTCPVLKRRARQDAPVS
ncbi:MAG: NosR/NirI family protein [Rhodobacter sp.]|nr:NosR/NirI family protein [Rhodobacter sp.]